MDKDITFDLSAGTMARLKLLVNHYGSIDAVVEQGIELLATLDSEGLSTRAVSECLFQLMHKEGSPSSIIEVNLSNRPGLFLYWEKPGRGSRYGT